MNRRSVGSCATFFIQNEWDGAYELGVILPSRVSMLLPESWGICGINAKFSWQDGKFEVELENGFSSPWWDVQHSGFTIYQFLVPQNVPKNRQVKVELNVISVCAEVVHRYISGQVHVFKRSDK